MSGQNGITVAVEGIDNLGKTTLVESLSERLAQRGFSVHTEPEFGADPLGSAIRDLVVRHWAHVPLDSQPLLIAAERRPRYRRSRELAKPCRVTLFDRHLLTARVYQSIALGVDLGSMTHTLTILYGPEWVPPDVTLLLDAPIAVSIQRGGDDIHSRAFLEEARRRYLSAALEAGTLVIDASAPVARVTDMALAAVLAALESPRI